MAMGNESLVLRDQSEGNMPVDETKAIIWEFGGPLLRVIDRICAGIETEALAVRSQEPQ